MEEKENQEGGRGECKSPNMCVVAKQLRTEEGEKEQKRENDEEISEEEEEEGGLSEHFSSKHLSSE